MKGVASLPARPSSCTVLKPPPPYSSCVVPSASGYCADSTAALTGYNRTNSIVSSVDEDDVKSRRRSRVCSRSPGSAPPTMAAKSRRYKRQSSGVEHARRQQQQQLQSYVNVTNRQLSATDCHGWPCVDAAYPPGTDYAAAAAACHSAAEVASCRYQTTTSVRPPYRHDLLAVVPAIGPGETGPAAERLKQMAAHYQRLAAASGGDSCGSGAPSSTSSFGCYDDKYSYEMYDEFAAQCQRFAVQPHYQQQSLYYDTSGYTPMVADGHGYLTATCNGVSQPPANSSHSQFALPEPVAIPASHMNPQYRYNGGLAGNVGYTVADEASRFMSPCAQQTTTTTTGLQAPVSLYSSSMTLVSSCQPTLVSTARQTTMCFAAESQRQPLDNFLDIYPTSASLTMSTSGSTSTTSSQLPSRRANLTSASTSSTLHLASVAAPVAGLASWAITGDCGGVTASTTWMTDQLDDVSTSPDAGVEAVSFCDSVSRGLDSASAKPAVNAELFNRQSTLGGIELY